MKYPYILFDLDGTLTDPAVGICGSIMYALEKGGYPVGEMQDYYPFIGPPLMESFMLYCGLDEGEAQRLTQLYRERYAAVGLYENTVYPGIPALLAALRDVGTTLLLATNKPDVFAKKILEHFGLAEYFHFVAGSALSGERGSKAEVIAYALAQQGSPPAASCVMVGDRRHDGEGARQNGIDFVGVLYGYGDREELTAAGAAEIVKSVPALHHLLFLKEK